MNRAPRPLAGRAVLVLLLLAGGVILLDLPRPAVGPPLEWRADLEAALAEAQVRGLPVLLSFHAPWCSACRKLDRRTLRHPAVAAELERFIRVRVDTSRPAARSDMQRFGVWAVPALLVLDAQASPQAHLRTLGFVEPETLLAKLRALRGSPASTAQEALTRRSEG